jgi:SAM-dependent methyltransferase
MSVGLAVREDDLSEIYSAAYYASHCGHLVYDRQEPHWALFFGGIAKQIAHTLHPRTVFDAGCAHGFLLEALNDRGVDVRGRDISKFAVSKVRSDLKSRVELGTISDPISGAYDLVTCIEVLEHMEEEDGLRAIASMAGAAPRLLFSSSPSDFEEPTHVNVRPVLWWLHRFAEAGLFPLVAYDASYVTPHAFLLERSRVGMSVPALDAFADLVQRRVSYHEARRTPDWMRSHLLHPLRRMATLMPPPAYRTARWLLRMGLMAG